MNAADINTQEVNIEVSSGTKIRVNVKPDDVFNEELFTDITNFSKALREGTDDEAIGQYIEEIDQHINHNVNARADIGARQNRIDLIENRVQEQAVIAKDMMSKNEDADMEKVIMNLTSQEAVHRAALSAGARVIQPTLMDFLR